MMLAALLLTLLQPYDFQKEHAAERLIEKMGRKVTEPEYHHFFQDAECEIVERGIDVGFSLPGQLLPGKTTALICSFDTKCGVQGHRHIFHTHFYGAWKPAEGFSYTIGEVCSEVLTKIARDKLPEYLRGKN